MTRGARAAGHGFLVATLLLAALATADVARAQDIVVDGEIVTAYDIDQRTKFDRLATRQARSREQVIDELRRETQALHEARERQRSISDEAVEGAYANLAARMRLTPAQLTATLAQQGIDAATLKRQIRADLSRLQLLRSRDAPFRMTDPPFRDRRPPVPLWCADCLEIGAMGSAARQHLRGDA